MRESKRNKGLIGKSFIHVFTLDMYLKSILSILVHTNFFDEYCISLIQKYHRYKDRERSAVNILNYLCTYNETRVNFVLNSKFFPRSKAISFVYSLVDDAKKFLSLRLMVKNKKEVSLSDSLFIFNLQNKWGKNYLQIIRNIISIRNEIRKLLNLISDHYIKFVVKLLLLRRRGEKDPDKLKSDAWFVISEMIDAYNPVRSKVPFNNILGFYAKNRKNKVIKEETWNLATGDIIYLGSMEQDNEKIDDNLTVSLDQFQKELNLGIHDMNLTNDRYKLIDTIISNVPKSLNTLIQIQFGLVDPFSLEEELRMISNY